MIMRYVLAALLVAVAGPSCAGEEEQRPNLNCDVGPLHKTYGKTNWLVYGCDDLKSLVVVSDVGNPAAPFYFMLYVKPDDGMIVYGEGNGKKSATKAAFKELKRLTRSDVATLFAQASNVGNSKQGE